MKCLLGALLLASSLAWTADTTVVVKAVNMETGARTNEGTGRTYTWHSMTVEVDGATYTIRAGSGFHWREHWLHKGSYTGRWKDSRRETLQVDVPDGNKIKRLDFRILSEQ